jgi:hypothetical protein
MGDPARIHGLNKQIEKQMSDQQDAIEQRAQDLSIPIATIVLWLEDQGWLNAKGYELTPEQFDPSGVLRERESLIKRLLTELEAEEEKP